MKWIEFELHARWQNKTRNSRAHNKTIHTNCFQKCATAVECFKKMYNWIQFKLYLLNKEEGKQERSPEEWKKSENFMQTLCIWTWCKLFALRGGTQAQQQNEAISFFCRLEKKHFDVFVIVEISWIENPSESMQLRKFVWIFSPCPCSYC